MTQPTSPIQVSSSKADNELLFKGILCMLIGLGVLVSPHFMAASAFSATVANAAVIGWFALVLGGAFAALFVRRRSAAAKANHLASR